MCLTYQYSNLRAQSKKAIHRLQIFEWFAMQNPCCSCNQQVNRSASGMQMKSSGRGISRDTTQIDWEPHLWFRCFLGPQKFCFRAFTYCFIWTMSVACEPTKWTCWWSVRGGSAPKIFLGFTYMKRVGFSLPEVYERVGKSVITV